MNYGIVKVDMAPLFATADKNTARVDEVLFGMGVEVLRAEGEWRYVRTLWQAEGYVWGTHLYEEASGAREWDSLGKMAARAQYVDVLSAPGADGAVLAGVPRGGLVRPLGDADASGYVQVELPGGGTGYAKSGNLMPQLTQGKAVEARPMREALATSALSYLGTQYRKGGRTPFGIDDEGLVGMALLLNGFVLPRGSRGALTAPLRKLPKEELAMGDILYFEKQMAMYLGDGSYIHATDLDGSDGVVINSIAPASPFYRADLAESLVLCASLFGEG
ncbi:C40 family peptidase [Clostridia bacterium OttesenSCG-928-O13]|nr:C40 family peptidase [Clostridia bacterium OttesenSCG-928-O13]